MNCPTILPTWPAVTVGDATGRIDMDGIAATDTIVDGGRAFDAIVVKGGRAYAITLDGFVDRATFEALLTSMTLTPKNGGRRRPRPHLTSGASGRRFQGRSPNVLRAQHDSPSPDLNVRRRSGRQDG